MTTPNAKNRASHPVMAGTDASVEAGGASGTAAIRASQPAIPRRGHNVADKREAILGAALELFVERGFWGTAVPEIADRAGVGAGTIYRYFESKEALVNAIYRQEKMRFSSSVLENFPANVNTREQFRTIWMRMAAFATANLSAFIFLELHHHASYLDNESRSVEQRMLQIITAVVHSAQQRRELKAGNTKLLMGMVMGAFVGVIRSCLDFDQPLDAADWAFAEQCIWEAIRS
jgi:AcrR family transcriptional regulator